MFSSLDQIDIVTKDEQGIEHYIQTDHRDPLEIEEQKDISVLFAMVRMLNPLRVSKTSMVEYRCQSVPPLFLQEAIASSGGVLMVGMQNAKKIPYEQPIRNLQEITNEAFHNLAQKEFSFSSPNFSGNSSGDEDIARLDEWEDELKAQGFPDPEEDNIRYWETIFKLAAVGGEILQKEVGGTWQVGNNPNLSSFPFVFLSSWNGEEAQINLLGKAMKFLANGNEDRISNLVSVVIQKAVTKKS